MAPQPNTLTGDTPTKNIRKRGGQKRARGTGFRSGAATGGNVLPAGMTPGLNVVDAVGFSRDLHALCNKYGIAWDDAILGGKKI